MFVRSKGRPEYAWEEYQKDHMSESMLANMNAPVNPPPSQEIVPPALDLGPPVKEASIVEIRYRHVLRNFFYWWT